MSAELSARLRERRGEIEQTILARVYAVSDPAAVGDPDYVAGLRTAVAAGLDYGIAGLGDGEEEHPASPVPPQLLSQARQAARNEVSLDTVLRRYFAGYVLLGDLVIEEAEQIESLRGPQLQSLLRKEAALFDRLLLAVTEEYNRERQARPRTAAQRRTERVRRLLSGEPLDTSGLDYDLDAWHLGAIATGSGAAGAIRELASALSRRLLLCRPEGETVWAWLGAANRLSAREAQRLGARTLPNEVTLALGEPARGSEGWRLTHRQAKAAMSIAIRRGGGSVRYGEVALLASALADEVLADYLREVYLAPLAAERDGGVTLRQTLGTYFAVGRNASSAAATLGISRNTVSIRLRAVEERLERPVDDCAAELETALGIWELARGGDAEG